MISFYCRSVKLWPSIWTLTSMHCLLHHWQPFLLMHYCEQVGLFSQDTGGLHCCCPYWRAHMHPLALLPGFCPDYLQEQVDWHQSLVHLTVFPSVPILPPFANNKWSTGWFSGAERTATRRFVQFSALVLAPLLSSPSNSSSVLSLRHLQQLHTSCSLIHLFWGLCKVSLLKDFWMSVFLPFLLGSTTACERSHIYIHHSLHTFIVHYPALVCC